MIKHVVMFKIKDFPTEVEKINNINKLKAQLEGLPGLIDELKYLEAGINVVKSERAYDLVLISDFESLQDLEVYRNHPAHLEVIEFVNKIKEQTIAVDYEY